MALAQIAERQKMPAKKFMAEAQKSGLIDNVRGDLLLQGRRAGEERGGLRAGDPPQEIDRQRPCAGQTQRIGQRAFFRHGGAQMADPEAERQNREGGGEGEAPLLPGGGGGAAGVCESVSVSTRFGPNAPMCSHTVAEPGPPL